MIEIDWKAATAIWGAGLSTWLALRSYLETRPICFVEPAKDKYDPHTTDVRLRIFNRKRYPILVLGLKATRRQEDVTAMRSAFAAGSTLDDVVNHALTQELNLLIPPGEAGEIILTFDGDKPALDVAIRWATQQPRIWPWASGSIRVKRSAEELRRLRHSVRGVEDEARQPDSRREHDSRK